VPNVQLILRTYLLATGRVTFVPTNREKVAVMLMMKILLLALAVAKPDLPE
jgi:hypothetical protein